jgi:two-component system, NarL family, sensor histidine kinase DesK
VWRRLMTRDEQAAPVVRWGIIAVAALNAGQVLRFLWHAIIEGGPGQQWWLVAATVVFLPLETFLLVAAIRNVRPRLAWPMLAGVALPVTALLPVNPYGWSLMLSVLFGLALTYFRPPVSLVLAALVLALVPASVLVISRPAAGAISHYYSSTGKAQYVSINVMDVLWVGLALAVMVWLTRIIRELDAARRELAARAVVIERKRIDDEVERTLGAALERIAARGELAAALARSTPRLAAGELTAITARSRATLAEARGMLTGYRELSACAELRAAVTLLAAGGVRATLVLPDTDLPPVLPAQARAALRAAVARALTESELCECVLTVTVASRGDLELCLAPAAAPVRGAA